jgi:hypothetical protein
MRRHLGLRWLATALAAPNRPSATPTRFHSLGLSAKAKAVASYRTPRRNTRKLSGCQEALERKPSGNSMRAITPAGLSGWCMSLGGETDVPPHRGRPRPARPAGEGVFFMQELHRPRTFRTRDRLRRPCAKNKEVWPNVSLTRPLHRSDEPTGVGRGAGRLSVSQPRLSLQPDKPAGGGLTIFPAGVVFDRSFPPANCPYVRTVALA